MRDLLVKATRSRVNDIIGVELRKLEHEVSRLEKAAADPVSSTEVPQKKPRPQIQTQTITNYGQYSCFDILCYEKLY